ncbi:hypothetical protein VOLCADRAFT_103525 [Volvox carteri f. nagariensis]|uniref:Peptidase S54 rhomboid domain-containing protein n=1 Tax=Volvox carteri f. nagariensis TaxID=3068 RepID=D8TMF5_VOLCA|nr:uncharacterized protein VOLCADRAFT_103525 [Volvox carteri f. nagariensis]EFJ51117.1 hypothetical protein VOLCADRAFT_103525 [Volvox carteri f. nagariensis]|eukprot:XP_002947584.1 hypothetical protein VOLCADRAFT_103525 [Volvox carteri f. nagariensis]
MLYNDTSVHFTVPSQQHIHKLLLICAWCWDLRAALSWWRRVGTSPRRHGQRPGVMEQGSCRTGSPERRPDKHGSSSSNPAAGDGPSLELSSGMAALIALNGVIFAGAAFAKLPPLAGLALYNAGGAWWQYGTSAFVHANLTQLSRNMFLLWLWGSALRRVVGGPGVWFTYVICALGSNMVAAYTLGAKAKAGTALLGVAASGGCAGVALAALALTARPSLRWLMAVGLAVQFTLPALLAAPVPGMPAVAGGAAAAGQSALARLLPGWMTAAAGDQLVGGAATVAVGSSSSSGLGAFLTALKTPAMSWLWGAAAGALIVIILAKLPVPPE